ncbi:methyl-accepting chemotaxis protein [Paenibacillus enshidis]|uniref:Methyl-accepting chemotaxis protein n=1 Tax=Paenibacillus enshidis TaxID=1458439 RepID=A0ABV5AXY5_9BACL
MNWYKNLKTATKIITSFLMVCLILGAYGVYSVSSLNNMNNKMTEMYNNNLISVRNLSAADGSFQSIRVNVRDISTAPTQAEKQELSANLDKTLQTFNDRVDAYRPVSFTPEEKELLAQFDQLMAEYIKYLEQAKLLAMDGDAARFNEFKDGTLKVSGNQVISTLQKLIEINVSYAQDTKNQSDQAYQSALVLSIILIAGSILLSILLGYLVSRSISRPLGHMVSLLERVSQGDLTSKSPFQTKDEVGLLSQSLNRMIESYNVLIGSITNSAQNVGASSQQIAASSEEIASSSSNQAESAASITELFKEFSQAINSVAKSAEEAAELSNSTVATAQQGEHAVHKSMAGMQEVNKTMHDLEENSVKIGDIIEVIDDIAAQTNLLALNAAIEAARAGDQGKGFAVVANEVRKLAERSSLATKEITDIIKTMQQNTKKSAGIVSETVSQSNQTEEVFRHIMEMVNQSSLKVNEIAAACEEQAAQASEVMFSVETIASASEQVAAASQETAATSQTLAHLAENLNESVAVFRTAQG